MQIIDGRAVSEQIQREIAFEVENRKKKGLKVPHLAAVLVGNDGGSQAYVGNKVKMCENVGFASTLLTFEASISQEELLAVVDKLNRDDSIDGFIVQLPLPRHIDETTVTLAIRPEKDVDGFHPANLGRMMLGLSGFLPATPAGILTLLERYQIPTAGKHCVVVGRSHIVGTPMSLLLSRNRAVGNSTVTLTHSRTIDLAYHTRQADILIAALGKPEFITADMVKEGAVVIDVGTTRVPDSTKKSGFTLKGDVKFNDVAPKTSYITPVPGGVGPMTVATLIQNTLLACTLKD